MHPHDHLLSFFTPRVLFRSAWGHFRLAARKPRLFAGLLLSAFRTRRAFLRFLRLPIDLDTISRSPLFDHDWYLRNHPDLLRSRLTPELHYLLNDIPEGRWSSPQFSGDEYLELNPEVRTSGVNPLVHYEQYGRFLSLPTNHREAFPPDPVFPEGASDKEERMSVMPVRHGRTAVFAAFASDGRFPEKDIFYIRALRDVCDNVVVVVNAPIFPEETERLRGLVSGIVARWHGGYDFGSYRIGMEFASRFGWLDSGACRELVFANDSCYAPVFPLSEMFRKMERRSADFWGLCRNTQCSERPYVQSFFLVFRRSVLDAAALVAFFAERPERMTRSDAISLFEQQLTPFLERRGFVADSLVPVLRTRFRECNPTTLPLTLICRYRSPLLKVKALSGQSIQPPSRILPLVKRFNPALASVIQNSVLPTVVTPLRRPPVADRKNLVERIGLRARNGEPVRVLFLVSSSSMFPARPLFDAMRRTSVFLPRIAVIPDLRWPERSPVPAMESCERELGARCPDALLPPLRPGGEGQWPEILSDTDLAVFPSPYESSDYHYNPSRADLCGTLGIHVNYGFYRSRYDRAILALESYARFWKVFLECDETLLEYRRHAAGGGSNAELTGYVKMDALATARPRPRNGTRKRILLAPHHSVDGGTNEALSLSNFQRYATFFLSLPARHPEIDFVFRPHPFLFTVLSWPSKWGRAKTEAWTARMKAHPNVFWSDTGDYFTDFASCDAIVQDCGSYLVEWFYTGKPCCYLLKSPADIETKFSPLGQECLRRCHLAYDESAIEAFLQDVVLGGLDPLAADREAFRRTIMVNYPHAAEHALQSLRRALSLPEGKYSVT